MKTSLISTTPLGYVYKILILVIGITTLYFIYTRALPYFNFEFAQMHYGTKALFIILHVAFGIIATLIGPFQFIASFRRSNLSRHRLIGKIYLLCTVFGALVSWYIIWPAANTPAAAVNLGWVGGLFFLGFAWIASAVLAFMSIKNKKIELHKEWMIRSYVITLAFVSFRLSVDVLLSLQFKEAGVAMAWACWAIPLLITEIVLQGRKIYN